MAIVDKKQLKTIKYGFTRAKKKLGINYWRFIFNGVDEISGSEQFFFIEYEMVNPWLSPNEVVLGFKPRVKITEDDLQYALAGTKSAQNFDTEDKVQPSYCAIRIGMLGKKSKQLCYYFPVKQVQCKNKPFELNIENKFITENGTSGFLSISEEDKTAHPEYLCDSGYVKWDITYDPVKWGDEGYNKDGNCWIPCGLKTDYTGKISFDGVDYLVTPQRSSGYMERYWGKKIPETWFHVSSATLTSVITGKSLLGSSFSTQGIFDNKLSFEGWFEDLNIQFVANKAKKLNLVWDCQQMPEKDDPETNLLHWTASFDDKNWVVDMDIFCKITELYNRSIELPGGARKILNLLEGASGQGEIKIYKKKGSTLEQIEHAQLAKVICEFGQTEEGEF